MKGSGYSEAGIELNLGWLYLQANIIDNAEAHFRNAFELKPQNKWYIYGLAYILINNDINKYSSLNLMMGFFYG
jgi:Flp pilus assembly protein TadD